VSLTTARTRCPSPSYVGATLSSPCCPPLLPVQTILGHRHVGTSLGYPRLYDGALAADYYRAMAQIEPKLSRTEERQPSKPGELLALVDALQAAR